MRLFLALFLTLLLFLALAHADQLQDGKTAFDHHQYLTALKLLQPLANQGNAEAEAKVGDIYADGSEGIGQNLPKAEDWWRKAADQGNADGEAGLGYLYFAGYVVKKNEVEEEKWYRKAALQGNSHGEVWVARHCKNAQEAAGWWRKAAEQNDPDAQFQLGKLYRDGKGVKQNAKEAATWFQKAADQESPWAQEALGNLYEKGQGVNKNLVQAYMWYAIIATGGPMGPSLNLDGSTPQKNIERIAIKMTPEQIAEGKRRAAEWNKNWAREFEKLRAAPLRPTTVPSSP